VFSFRPLLTLLVAVGTSLGLLSGTPAQARISDELLRSLESALNSPGNTALAALIEPGQGLNPRSLEARHLKLRQLFSDAQWQLSQGSDLRDGRSTLLVKVTGSHVEAGRSFRLEANQKLAVRQNGMKLSGQELLGEEAILRSGKRDLEVSVIAPEEVLTGQRYNLDVVMDQPLDDAVIAGGLAELTPDQLENMRSPELQLGALNGGGLFKTIQAPYKPGSQSWAVLLLHPEGTVSISRMVRVVNRRGS
jgi:hypothetical protein